MFHNPNDNIAGSYRWEKRKINHKKNMGNKQKKNALYVQPNIFVCNESKFVNNTNS